jgi:L-seryl-tRNA(Ser) seleniumtransferase
MDLKGQVKPDPRRRLPSVDQLARTVAEACPELPKWAVVTASREVVQEARVELDSLISQGAKESKLELALGVGWSARVGARASRLADRHPRRVINATGVVLHTNLGRAPIAREAALAGAEVASGYSDLELDLDSGRRGQRLDSLARKLEIQSGAEAAMAVNNNAAAVLLMLNTLAQGREVIVSRGELVEIGGSFRVPAIMERAGVRLIEVGTTNRTHPRDYAEAIGSDTALLLKVHRSNFEQTGFVTEVDLGALVELGRERGIPVVEDLGAGSLVDLTPHGFPAEAYAPGRLRTGVDLICFSGDKLFGGPQAGILLGRSEMVERMRANPLARALRLDKMTLSALDWTVGALLEGRGKEQIPALRMLLEPASSIEQRARELEPRLRAIANGRVRIGVEVDRAPVGGGSLPGFELETRVVALRRLDSGPGPEPIARRMREAPVPVLSRIRDDALLLDLRTVSSAELEDVVESLAHALR